MKTCVVIPTYNESKAIADLTKGIRQQNLEVVVVDDGSHDNTAQLAEEHGAIVLRNPSNVGKGASLVKGFRYALSKDFDAVIAMDGDGQHIPQDIPYFLRLAQYSESRILIGNRMHKANTMPRVRFLTNRFMSWFISRVAKQKIPDSQCGFRLIKRELLEKLNLGASKYEVESEIIIKASRLGCKIESVPIKTIYNGGKSRINPVIDTFRFIRFIIKEILTQP